MSPEYCRRSTTKTTSFLTLGMGAIIYQLLFPWSEIGRVDCRFHEKYPPRASQMEFDDGHWEGGGSKPLFRVLPFSGGVAKVVLWSDPRRERGVTHAVALRRNMDESGGMDTSSRWFVSHLKPRGCFCQRPVFLRLHPKRLKSIPVVSR